MVEKKFKFIDSIKSDVMFEAYGLKIEKLFENSALALSSVICQIKKVKAKKKLNIKIKSESLKELLFDFLSKLISLSDIEEIFFSKFKVKIKKNMKTGKKYLLNALLWGESISKEKGETVVKAVTKYGFEFKKEKKGYKARVSLDI